MIVLHAVTTPFRARDDAEGLCSLTTSAVTVLFAEVEQLPVATRGAIVEHGRRVARLAERRPVLPIRYGTTVETLREVEAMAREHAAEWRQSLDRVAGHCELLVHLDPVPDEQPRAASGTDHLRRRADALHRQEAQVGDVVALVGRWSRDVRLLPDRRRLAVLVPREQAGDVQEALNAWSAARDDIRVAVTGPWPPFSFCSQEDR